ncbi:MAG: C40 family peptidase [Chromatiales bacterium]
MEPVITPDRPDGLHYALSLTGMPYRFGGSSPREGFDCSGFVQHVFARLGVILPHNANAMASQLPRLATPERRPGDLVFFNTNGRPHSHVGIYLGGDRFIHATSRAGRTVKVSSLREPYWQRRLDGLRRPALTIGSNPMSPLLAQRN